jgi:hypothetical protein
MNRKLPSIIVAIVFTASACAQDVTVHVRGGDRPPDSEFLYVGRGRAQASTPGSLVVTGGATVDKFQIVLRNIRLQSEPIDGGSADTPGAAIIGPNGYLVDLPGSSLTGGTFTPLLGRGDMGAKGFYEMDIDLSPVTDADSTAQPELSPLLGRTFEITGHNQAGTPFTIQSTAGLILPRSSVFRMGLNHNNLDINIAPNQWFGTPDGGTLDPASSDPAVRSQIEQNVLDSIDAYEDDDMDGNPDPLG